MRSFLLSLVALCLAATSVAASVFLPYNVKATANTRNTFTMTHGGSSLNAARSKSAHRELARLRRSCSTSSAAMAIPGYGIAEQVFVGGFGNFLSVYNLIITARILLSWFPQAQGVAALAPLYQITDPFLNLFRGVIPPIMGLDLSPLAAFFLLNVLTNATAAVGAEITPEMRKKMEKAYKPFAVRK
jgi:YggT family protein